MTACGNLRFNNIYRVHIRRNGVVAGAEPDVPSRSAAIMEIPV